MPSIISVSGLSKTYAGGFQALRTIDLEIRDREIFALLGPNGAGKTTLINIICGVATATEGLVRIAGRHFVKDYRTTRAMIGLVPQELVTDAFETVWNTVSFSRGLFGLRRNPAHIEKVLKDLSLWDKKDAQIRTLSGGMKRRVMIAKALSHEPRILFLDEPTAGVDVELRRDMWRSVRALRDQGATIILTTHYIEEAEEMADRIGVINRGQIVLVEQKAELMRKLGRKRLFLDLHDRLDAPPPALERFNLQLAAGGHQLVYSYDAEAGQGGVGALLDAVNGAGLRYRDIHTEQSSLEEIFVELVRQESGNESGNGSR